MNDTKTYKYLTAYGASPKSASIAAFARWTNRSIIWHTLNQWELDRLWREHATERKIRMSPIMSAPYGATK